MLFYLSLFIFLGALFISLQWFIGGRKLLVLDTYSTDISKHSPPFISVIVAAKNEEQNIYKSVHSLLDQHYPHFEVIVVNDRSSDHTLSFLMELKEKHKNRHKLQIVSISSLPDGWLGKNHALYQGTKHAKGDWLIFTDGDVLFSKETLNKAINCIVSNQLDHLTIIPENIGGTIAYKAFHSYWSILGVWNFIQLKHAGVGAFNMINATVYHEIGTHKALALSPDDDLKLGKRIVKLGFRQKLGFGKNMIRIQWYESIPQVISGLEKNLFAFMRYNTFLVILFSILLFLFHVFPFIGIFSNDLLTRSLFSATILLYIVMYVINIRFVNDKPWLVLSMPFNGILFIYCLCRSAYKTLKRGRVKWRDTEYSLKELRRYMKNN
ncbi:glycosyltransferase [Salipaludibacillus sp. HK11]|uniref:glycosyltransferase n=1 Tax=Salipaludibacillus sp. HK11 TaxID=3394320 RepID=UPI0039FCD0EA